MIRFIQVNNSEGGRSALRVDTIVAFSEARGKVYITISDGANNTLCEVNNTYDEVCALIKEAQE